MALNILKPPTVPFFTKSLSKNNLYSLAAANNLPRRLINRSCTTYFWTGTLYLTKPLLTGGMLPACVDSVDVLRGEFKKLTNAFNTAIRPEIPNIKAMQGVERKIDEEKRKSEQAEDSVEKNTKASPLTPR